MSPWELIPWAIATAISLVILAVPVTIMGLAIKLVKAS